MSNRLPALVASLALTAVLATTAAAQTYWGGVHVAAAENTAGHLTFLPLTLAGSANDRVQVTQLWDGWAGGVYNAHPIGLWFSSSAGRWAVMNLDYASMPLGARFVVKSATTRDSAFQSAVHRAATSNVAGNVTYLDTPFTNGHPYMQLQVTSVLNPGGGAGGVYNAHALGVWYDGGRQRWAIYNQDGAAMPAGAAFHVETSFHAHELATVSTTNRGGAHWFYVDSPYANGFPGAKLLVTARYEDSTRQYVRSPVGVFYVAWAGKWAIFTEDGSELRVGSMFNVLIMPSLNLIPQ